MQFLNCLEVLPFMHGGIVDRECLLYVEPYFVREFRLLLGRLGPWRTWCRLLLRALRFHQGCQMWNPVDLAISQILEQRKVIRPTCLNHLPIKVLQLLDLM